jgi:hypothetical protein
MAEETPEPFTGDTQLTQVKQMNLSQVYNNPDMLAKFNALNAALNREPRPEWVRKHPFAKVKNDKGQDVPVQYIPIGIIEYLLTNIFILWRVEIKECKIVANSMITVVRLHVLDPITGQWTWQDGAGGAPLQTDSGKGAIDFNYIKSGAVQMATPSSESYAIGDAAEKFGKIFGKDLNRHGNSLCYGALDKKFLNA